MNVSGNTSSPIKLTYVTPTLKVIGTFEQITKATAHGEAVDVTLGIHTPIANHLS